MTKKPKDSKCPHGYRVGKQLEKCEFCWPSEKEILLKAEIERLGTGKVTESIAPASWPVDNSIDPKPISPDNPCFCRCHPAPQCDECKSGRHAFREALPNNNGSREEKGTDAKNTPSDITAGASNGNGVKASEHMQPDRPMQQPATLREQIVRTINRFNKENAKLASLGYASRVLVDQLLALFETEANKRVREILEQIYFGSNSREEMGKKIYAYLKDDIEQQKANHHSKGAK